MIFKGFKKKSNQLFFRSKLQNWKDSSEDTSPRKIENVLVFIDKMTDLNTIYSDLLKALNLNRTT